jgi:thiol-disulfide isomerase/thioredoxin
MTQQELNQILEKRKCHAEEATQVLWDFRREHGGIFQQESELKAVVDFFQEIPVDIKVLTTVCCRCKCVLLIELACISQSTGSSYCPTCARSLFWMMVSPDEEELSLEKLEELEQKFKGTP